MADAHIVIKSDQSGASSPIQADSFSSPNKQNILKDLHIDEMGASSRTPLMRRDTFEEKSLITRRSSVETVKSSTSHAQAKRLSLNVTPSQTPGARRASKSKFGEAAIEEKGVSGHGLKRGSTLRHPNPGKSPMGRSPADRNSKKDMRTHSTKEFGDYTGNSRTYSELEDLQDLYHKNLRKKKEGSNTHSKNTLDPTPVNPSRRTSRVTSRIAQVYYEILRKKFSRSNHEAPTDTLDFLKQIEDIKENTRTPNEERLKDLAIVEKTPLERIKDYRDTYPLLKLRKNVVMFFRYIGVICEQIINHNVFESFILVVILFNSVLLAFDDPTTDTPTISAGVDDALLIIYTIEMTLKIAGMGFLFNKGAYLRDAWNVMDFVIVVTAYIPMVLASDGVNLQAFRSLRVLRPLRTISNIQNLRVLILTLLEALRPLLDTLFILLFAFMIFAIGGLQLFGGLMKKRCFSVDDGIPLYDPLEDSTEYQKLCASDDDCATNGILYICGKMVKDPNYDITNFDTIQNSFLMVFQIVTLEGWSDIMVYLEKTFSSFVAIYFVCLIIIGSFFLLNLTLAVLKAEFTKNNHEEAFTKKKSRKYWSHDKKLIDKLEHHKGEVLKLVHKRKHHEISFNKYEFKKNNLIALTAENAKAYKQKRRNANRTGLDWLRNTIFKKFVSKKGFVGVAAFVKNLSNFRKGTPVAAVVGDPKAANTVQALKTGPGSKPESKNDFMKTVNAVQRLHLNLKESAENSKEKLDSVNLIPPEKSPNNRLSISINKESATHSKQNSVKLQVITNKDQFRGDGTPMNKTPSLVIIPSMQDPVNDRSDHSFMRLNSKNLMPIQRNNFMAHTLRKNTPIRPVLDEKSHLKPPVEGKAEGVTFVNIAGIRNKPNKKKKKDFREITPESNEISLEEEISVLDLATTSDGKQPEQLQHRESLVAKKPMIRKMNQIMRFGSISKSRSPKRNNGLASIFDIGDESETFERTVEGMAPTGILDDSDFFDEHQRHTILNKKTLDKFNKKKMYGGRSPNRRGQTTIGSFGALKDTSAHLRGNHPKPSKQQVVSGEGSPSPVANRDFEETYQEDEDEKFIIDVRYLKAEPNFQRAYDAISADDVLPLKKERELKKIEDEEAEMLKQARLKQEFRITKNDFKKAEDRMNSMYSKSESCSSTILAQRSSITRRMKQKKMEEIELDEKMFGKGPFGYGFGTGTSKQNSSRNPSKSLQKKKTGASGMAGGQNTARTGVSGKSDKGQTGDDDKYLAPEKMKDYVEVLNWMTTPFDNEAGLENPEDGIDKEKEEFRLTDQYKNIRKKDLANGMIKNANWSGDTVLAYSNSYFPIDRVKMALTFQNFDIWRPGFFGVLHGIRNKIIQTVDSDLFNAIIMLSVFFNTIILGSEGLISDSSTIDLLSDFNFTFTIIFTIEMAFKLIGLGIVGYVSDKINLFDAAVVIISLVEEIFLSGGGNKAVSAFRTVRLFRTFRVLRVTKLLRSLSYVKVIIGVITRSLNRFIYIIILLFLFIFIYTLLGMQLYGGGLNLADNIGQNKTRQNFDTFMNAFMTVFQIMTQENWQQILFLSIRSEAVNTLISIIYLVSWIFIGNYIFLNLFLAILLDDFTGDAVEDMKEIEEDEKEEEENNYALSASRGQTLEKGETRKSGAQKTLSKDSNQLRSLNSKIEEDNNDDDDDGESVEQKVRQKAELEICEKAFFFLHKDNLIRKICLKIIQHPYFEKAILTMIVASSIKLALDTYIDDTESLIYQISDRIDDGFNIFFAVEASLKIISLGFVFGKTCYLKDSWNILDFVIVVASILDMSFQNVNLSFIKILRLLRTLRPLRFITHNESMRLVVTALLESMVAIANVIIVVMLVWFMFAILAINIVGSKLGYCDGLPTDQLYYGISETQCGPMGFTWKNPNVNFDNVFQAMLSLFILSTQEGWPDIMYSVVDANDSTEGPAEGNQRIFGYLYFMVFLFIGSYFLVNLFVGVIFMNFMNARKKENHMQKFLMGFQQDWVITQRLIILTKPDISNVEPDKKWMKKIFRIINHTYFDIGIMCVIVLNILTMALSYDGSSDQYNNILKYINWFFSSIFAIELILKHLGLGFKRYWSIGWNQFDAFVVLASIIDILMDVMEQSFFSFIRVGPQLARVFRVLRVTRLFKLVKQFEGLQNIINTLIFSLPSLLNVGALLFLVYFIYACLATYLFQDVIEGERIDEFVHFRDFGTAIITMFRCSTGEDWYKIMFDTLYPKLCSSGAQDCGTWAALVFWITFILICQFIFLNLFILVILQQFEDYHLNPDNPVIKFRKDLENQIKPSWETYALKNGGYHIKTSQLTDFFCSINYPYGYKNYPDPPPKKPKLTRINFSKMIMQLNLPLHSEDSYFYNDIIFALFKNSFMKAQKIYEDETEKLKKDEWPTPEFVAQYHYLAAQEQKTKEKLKKVRKNVKGIKLPAKSLLRESTTMVKSKKALGANPILRMLFMGMTMKAWIKYAQNKSEKIKAAKENGMEYMDSESDENDYTIIDPDAPKLSDDSNSDDSRDRDDSDSETGGNDDDKGTGNGYIKEVEEHDSSEDDEKHNTEQQSLIEENAQGKKLKDSSRTQKDTALFKIKPNHIDCDEEGDSFNIKDIESRTPVQNRGKDPAKITITSYSSKNLSHFELEKNKSLSRLTPQHLAKYDGEGGLDYPHKTSFSFLEPDKTPKKFESKKSSKNNLLDEQEKNDKEKIEKPKIINYNISNNVIINNNFFINQQFVPETGDIAISPISRETSITIERNISISKGVSPLKLKVDSQGKSPSNRSKEGSLTNFKDMAEKGTPKGHM